MDGGDVVADGSYGEAGAVEGFGGIAGGGGVAVAE